MVVDDFDLAGGPIEIQNDVCRVTLRKGEAVQPGVHGCSEFNTRVEGVEIDRVVTGRRFLAFLVVGGWSVVRRHGPVADHGHEHGTARSAGGEAEHRRVRVIVGPVNTCVVLQCDIGVDRTEFKGAMRQ